MKTVLLCLLCCRPCVASRGATAARARYATASTIVPFRPAYQRSSAYYVSTPTLTKRTQRTESRFDLLCFARLSTQVLTGSKDGRALLIDTKGSTSAPHQQVAKDTGKEVLSVAWRPGAPTQMAFGTNGGAIFIHDTSKEEGYNAAAPPGRLWPDLSRNSYHGPGAKHEDGTSKKEREDPNIHVSRQHAALFCRHVLSVGCICPYSCVENDRLPSQAWDRHGMESGYV